jgi:hypothetical protein
MELLSIKKYGMGGACGTCGENSNADRVLVGKREGRRQLGKGRHRWEHNIKINFKANGMGGRGLC